MNLPIAPIAAAVLAIAAVLGVVLIPITVLEAMVMDSGLPALIHAAEPPLGTTARLLLSLLAGGLAGLLGWFLAFIVVGTQGVSVNEPVAMDDQLTPSVRRADAHPDAPPRPPLLATRDLGMPFPQTTKAEEGEIQALAETPVEKHMDAALDAADQHVLPADADADTALPRMPHEDILELTVREETGSEEPLVPTVPVPDPIPVLEEKEVPADLDQPLAAFDPGALRAAAISPVETIVQHPSTAPQTVEDTPAQFEAFELKPPALIRFPAMPRPEIFTGEETPEPPSRPEGDGTVHALLERLERGVIRRGLATGMERSKPAEPARDPERGLEEALVTLRNLAKRA